MLWHGWLPSLDSNGNWAVGAGGSVSRVLEASLGSYSPHQPEAWVGSEEFTSGTTSGQPDANPNVWTDGSLVRDEVAGVCCGGSGVFAAFSGAAWFRRSWGRLDLLPPHAQLDSECCRLFYSLPGSVQSAQRAELLGVIWALQAAKPVHLGVDNANVVGHVNRIIAGKKPLRHFQILLDGDLLLLIQMLISARGESSTIVSKVKRPC